MKKIEVKKPLIPPEKLEEIVSKNPIEKFIGSTVTPNHNGYWDANDKKQLVIDDVKIVNLGTGCEKTQMYHFEGDNPKKWEIATQFSKPKFIPKND